MGWDAYSEPFTGFDHGVGEDKYSTPDPLWAEAVEAARKDRTDDRIVDGLLQHGGLDCSTCAYALEAATGKDCWGSPWSPEEVKKLAKKARWDRVIDEPEWAMRSAKAFLEHCAKLDRGVRFSY
jgi:hypothetical protein